MLITELLLAELDREAWAASQTTGHLSADRSKISIDSTVLDELQEFLIKPKPVTPYSLR
jgi:hypothetical protein